MVLRALTEGDIVQPPGSASARWVMRDAGVRTLKQYPDKVCTGEDMGRGV